MEIRTALPEEGSDEASSARRHRVGRSPLVRAVAGGTSGRVGVVLVGIVILVALLGPYAAPYGPTEIATALPHQGPSAAHLLGTDALGRDVLSRLLNGGRSVLVLPTLATLLGFAVGGALGLVSGYKGGFTDFAITRVVDVLLSMPPLLIIMVMVIVLGGSDVVLVTVVGVFFAPRIARIIRGATQAVCSEDYIVAAQTRGEGTWQIIVRELAPNISGPMLAECAMRLTYAIITITTLNFLGLGVQPPSSDWGLMVSDGRVVLAQNPLESLAPAAMIAIFAIGVNLISDQISVHLARDVRRDVKL